jgi:putative protease
LDKALISQAGPDGVQKPPLLRILAPVDREEEVGPLASAGAHELYGGVQPDGWLRAGRGVSANQRTFSSAQFPSEASFARAAAEARRAGAPLRLALNAPLYDPPDYPELLALAERAAGWGVAGVIAGDLGLLARLSRAGLPLDLTLSTMAGAMNRASLAFYRRFGISRAVLPRHLTLAEMAALVEAHPDVAFEAFALVGRCPNEEAYCTFQHASPSKRWPCEIPYALSDAGGGPLPAGHPLARWHASWRQADRRLACGLCAIPELARIGVRHLKLVGRGGATSAKVANVVLVRAFLAGDRSPHQAREAYVARFGRPCHPLVCYFPELHPARAGGACMPA